MVSLRLCFLVCLSFFSYAHTSDFDGYFSNTDSFKRAHIGICVTDVKTGEEIYSLHDEEYFTPASLQKIVVSVAAMQFLGEDYRFGTELQYDGQIDPQGTLHGNVWIVGGADPSLSLDIISSWKGALQEKGIHKIDGKIFVDTSCFETALASPYWYFQDLGNYYGAGASGLTIHENLYHITFAPGSKEGDPAQVIQIDPPIPNLKFHNEVITGPAGSGDQVNVYGIEYSPVQFYRGTVPIDQPTFRVKAAIPDPAFFCGDLLSQAIQTLQGIEVIREKPTTSSHGVSLFTHKSEPLKELLQKMNYESNNLYAEHLCKAIGEGSAEKGISKMERMLSNLNIPSKIRDGAGLARSNLITPKGFVKLLTLIHNDPLYESVYASFPEPGKKGTLQSFPNLFLASLKAKTGSMTGIYCLGGYFTLESGKEYVFSIFCNQYDGKNSELKKEIYRFLENAVNQLEKRESSISKKR